MSTHACIVLANTITMVTFKWPVILYFVDQLCRQFYLYILDSVLKVEKQKITKFNTFIINLSLLIHHIFIVHFHISVVQKLKLLKNGKFHY